MTCFIQLYKSISIKGEFHLGMMSGKGKYTWASGIVYEGDFVNNEITGSGIFRWPDSK